MARHAGSTQDVGGSVDHGAYHGREQALLKHEVLKSYLETWGFKLGSIAKTRQIKLWYVDCFAGPWKSADQEHRDTSVGIGLDVLTTVERTWREQGIAVPIEAIFVEKDASAFAELETFVEKNKGVLGTTCIHGAFEDQISFLREKINDDDPALVFVDPLGWSGASLQTLRPLTGNRYREVLVNVMSSFAHRFTGAENAEESIRAMLDLDDSHVLDRMTEEQLSGLYRRRLKETCGYRYALDIAIPAPNQDRIWYRLVLGTNSEKGVEVFRNAEARMAKTAGDARASAKRRKEVAKSNQPDLFAPAPDLFIENRLNDAVELAERRLPEAAGKGRLWRDVWPEVLEDVHVRKPELNKLAKKLLDEGTLEFLGWQPRQRAPKDDQLVRSKK